ncbi:hypothetical protein [Psychrobacter sp. 16-MNA-CIBAN-0192]|uniref:hypothetical protein n=1 Tax=Psychrobacter sp. 16-MNA-CIBAN-0192 TaxID=3140448 RepID=UPI00331E9A96
MTDKHSLRIDTAIKPSSHLRTALYASLIVVMGLLAWLAELSLAQNVLLLIVSAGFACYLALIRPILLHISQPPLQHRVDQHWQLLMRTSRDDALWQAHLSKLHRYPLCIHFEFSIIEPYQRSLSFTVFRDQVSAREWRQLNILATVVPITAH